MSKKVAEDAGPALVAARYRWLPLLAAAMLLLPGHCSQLVNDSLHAPPPPLPSVPSTPANCTSCDHHHDVLTLVQPPVDPSSLPVAFLKSNLSAEPTDYSPRDVRHAPLADITTVSPTIGMGISQDDEPLPPADAPASITTASTPKSTAFPVLGFGDFRYPDDDEDFPPAIVKSKAPAVENVAQNNVGETSSSSYSNNDIREAFGDHLAEGQEGAHEERDEEHQEEEASYEADEDRRPYYDFEEQIRYERRLILGNPMLMPKHHSDESTLFTMQQGPLSAFEGCYCDHVFKVTTFHHSGHHEDADYPPDYGQQYPSADAVHQRRRHVLQYDPRENSTTTADGGDHQHSEGNNNNHSPPPPHKMDIEKDVVCYCFGGAVTKLPSNFSLNVRKIILKRVGIEVLEAGDFSPYANSLTEIYMTHLDKLHRIDGGVFSHLPYLMTIYIKMAPLLKSISEGAFFGSIPKLMHLKVIHCGLEKMPLIYQNSDNIITSIDFDNSRIRNLTTRIVNVKAESLNLEYNEIEFVGNHAFTDSEIAKLSLKGNKKLVHLEEFAFSGLGSLRELDLSQTSITKLPTDGLSLSLEVLKITDTTTLKEIPHIYHFTKMREAHLTYPYHCCAFRNPANHRTEGDEYIRNLANNERFCKQSNKSSRPRRSALTSPTTTTTGFSWFLDVVAQLLLENFGLNSDDELNTGQHRRTRRFLGGTFGDFVLPYSNDSNGSADNRTVYGVRVYEQKNRSSKSGFSPYKEIESSVKDDESDEEGTRYHLPTNYKGVDILPGRFGPPIKPQTTINTAKPELCGDFFDHKPVIQCYPAPDAFNPCEDVMGNYYLRCIVWLVVVAAVLGNAAVIVVLVSGRFTFSVSKFLMINLAIADLMLGIYLLMIAITDVRTVGVYFNYAIDWQHGSGCKWAGGLTVFGSVLSIFTLTVITLERWFAINFAIQLNRRLKMGIAAKVMIGGWLYALLMALLPAYFGVNSYSKTSICLPMEHKHLADKIYLGTLLTFNCSAFVIIVVCYMKMYISIISQKTRATKNDLKIAKRMGMLVLTDFICWAPIAFFGLTALAGYPLIDVPKSKILLVTFYPINSCANPFLYAILTKQYRRDFFILLSRYGLCKAKAMTYRAGARQGVYDYKHNHGHRHHRANSQHSEPRVKCVKSTPASGSIFSQLSCDGQNVHLYRYICKGHRHHHFCAAYKQPNSTSGDATSASHFHCHHGCSDAEHNNNNNSSDHEELSDQPCCSKYSQECDSKSGSVASLTAEKRKHRKHKRCHNAHHHHHSHLQCRCQHQRHCHGHGQSRCGGGHPKPGPVLGNGNKASGAEHSASCCHSAVFSTVNIYPEFSNTDSNGHHHGRGGHRGHEMCERCSCQTDNELAVERESREKNSSSSREHVHMMRNKEKNHTGALNGRVMYSRNKSIAVDTRINSTVSKATHAKYAKPKRSLPFVSFIERFSIASRLGLRNKGKKNFGGCSSHECSEASSPYSSNSDCHRHHRMLCHHHHRCCSGAHLEVPSGCQGEGERESSHASNQLPMEEQREILRQALAETTTVQEAVAVVEELSSGRVSMGMDSSSSSKKASAHKTVSTELANAST